MTTVPTTREQPDGYAPAKLLAPSIVARAQLTDLPVADPNRRFALSDLMVKLAQLEDAPLARFEQVMEQRAVLHEIAGFAAAWVMACDREMVALVDQADDDHGTVAA
jgi:hypothetical protein